MAFHVPEAARVEHPFHRGAAGNNGAFDLESCTPGWRLMLVCSDGDAWEHVSVHAYRSRGGGEQTRTPAWVEMVFVKNLYWDDDDLVMQLHPRRRDYVDVHPNVLHLWRPTAAAIPEPSIWMV